MSWQLFIPDRVLSNREIAEAYRARMPLDFVTVDSVFYANEPAGPSVVLAPGGTFTQPNPVEGYTNITATGDATLELFDRKPLVGGAVRTPLAVKTFKNLAVVREADIAFDPVTVAPGLYDVRLTLRLPTGTVYRRTRPYSATERFDASSVKTAAEPWQKGELVYAKSFRAPADMDFTDGVPVAVGKRAHLWPWRRAEAPCADYLEGDSRGGKRMAVVMTIPPEAANNETLLLEIDWPDDKPRSMGLYMYPEGRSGVRDRLQMGIQAGREYPETFKMQTAAYPIYATKTNLLLELRTMVQGWPAAVSAVRIYRLAQPLPKLALNLPKGEKGRSLGHLDEDQTLYNNLGRQATGPVVNELIRYFNYTGQNAIVYPMIRYYFGFCAAEGPLDGNGMFPGRQGEFSYVLRTLKENGIEFTGPTRMVLIGRSTTSVTFRRIRRIQNAGDSAWTISVTSTSATDDAGWIPSVGRALADGTGMTLAMTTGRSAPSSAKRGLPRRKACWKRRRPRPISMRAMPTSRIGISRSLRRGSSGGVKRRRPSTGT